MTASAFITGLSGLMITADERAFLRDAEPWGLILFKRNIEEPAQVRALVEDFREVIGRADAPVLIDQEGGRVARLQPPHWQKYPPGAAYGAIYDRDRACGLAAATLGARLIASDLAALGINVDCLPLADVPVSEADLVIGDRAYGETPAKVAALAQAIADGLAEGGVLPVLKHIPGHGRANADSHLALPRVDTDRATLEAIDFAAFRPLAGLPMAMTAHVVYSAIDPVRPATTSATIVSDVIRGFIGFAGVLMSDDMSMGALSGSLGERTRAAFEAGCDIALHCNGKIEEMQAVASESSRLAGVAAERVARAMSTLRNPADIDVSAARTAFSTMMSGTWPAGEG